MVTYGSGNTLIITKSYIVVADVARGDSSDYSACHVIDVEQASEQVAEYKG